MQNTLGNPSSSPTGKHFPSPHKRLLEWAKYLASTTGLYFEQKGHDVTR